MATSHVYEEIIFIHIPRTGGTYIEKNLCKKYKISKIWPDVNLKNLFGLYKIKDKNFITWQHLTIKEMIKYNFISQ